MQDTILYLLLKIIPIGLIIANIDSSVLDAVLASSLIKYEGHVSNGSNRRARTYKHTNKWTLPNALAPCFAADNRLSAIYSRTSLMWTPEGRTKSVHISKVSIDYIRKTQQALRKVSTRLGCPHRWGVHSARFYCT